MDFFSYHNAKIQYLGCLIIFMYTEKTLNCFIKLAYWFQKIISWVTEPMLDIGDNKN